MHSIKIFGWKIFRRKFKNGVTYILKAHSLLSENNKFQQQRLRILNFIKATDLSERKEEKRRSVEHKRNHNVYMCIYIRAHRKRKEWKGETLHNISETNLASKMRIATGTIVIRLHLNDVKFYFSLFSCLLANCQLYALSSGSRGSLIGYTKFGWIGKEHHF